MKILAWQLSDFPIQSLIISTAIEVRPQNTISVETHSKHGRPVIDLGNFQHKLSAAYSCSVDENEQDFSKQFWKQQKGEKT